MAIQDAYFSSIGSIPYDDAVTLYAFDTTGKIRVQSAPTSANEVARLADVSNPANFTLPVIVSLPSPNSSYRGRVVRLAAEAGVADQVFVCLKDSTDAYVWMQMVVVP